MINENIPFHFFKDSVKSVKSVHGESLKSLESTFPFLMTNFETAADSAQATYPHRHDFYEVLYISAGEGTHIIDFEPYPVKPNTFYFLSKDQIHFWQLTQPLKGYILLLTEDFLDIPSSNILRAHDFEFFHHVGQAPYLSIDKIQSPMINVLFESIETEFHNDSQRSLTVLRAYMHILFTQLNRLYALNHPVQRTGKTSSLLRQFTQLVYENFKTEHFVHFYADKIGISDSHLTDTIKAVTGHPPGYFIRQKLILEAKRLLVHNNVSIAEIGYRLNFEDASYFSRFFKRETGMTPASFRKKIRDKYQINTK